MNQIFVRSNFADRHEYRLVSVDDAWLKRFDEKPCGAPHTASRKRARPQPHTVSESSDDPQPASHAGVSVVLVMKGEDQLCLHNDVSTRFVRRVEYSNVLMLARRRLNAAGAAAVAQETSADASSAAAPTVVRAHNDDVVVASLTRMFDSNAANPQLNLLTVLANSYLTIEELERDDEGDEGDDEAGVSGKAASSSGFTFAELTRAFHSSPAELARQLQEMGAVVHHGKVRLLQPSLVYEALAAVLAFAEGLGPQEEITWDAARTHLCPSVYPAVVLRSLEAVYGAKESAEVHLVGLTGLLCVPRVLVGLAAGIFDTHSDVVERRLSTTAAVARGLPLDTFLEKWMDSIPSSFYGCDGLPARSAPSVEETLLDQLRGFVVVESRGGTGGNGKSNASHARGTLQSMVWWLPKETLTNDFAARLRLLFELRPQRWHQPDLQAYMEVLLGPDQSFAHVIVRYAREYRIPGQPVQYAPLT